MKIFRHLLVFLLAFAISLQGIAASTQIFCHLSGSVFAVNPKITDHSHHQALDQHEDQTKSPDHPITPAEIAKSANHQCSTCAQCCFVAALLPAPLILVFNQEASSLVATSNVLLGAISPLNIERPPRSFLA